MSLYLIILIIISSAFSVESDLPDNSSGCLTDELYGDFTDEEYNNLVARRKLVRLKMKTNLFRNETDTLFVPVVFHNLYKIATGEPVASYCDYDGGLGINNFEYVTGNNQEICNQRMLRSLKVLNGNYAPSGIQFVLHSDYPNMLHATDPGFDGFYERATDGTATSPDAHAIKEHYNIPNALNIYIVDIIMNNDGKYGISTYPWSSDLFGVFIKQGHLPGDVDVQPQADYYNTLMHEIGHYFSLVHINGSWYAKKGNTPRDLVNGTDCNEHGDTICDTPAEPGESVNAWYTNSLTHECIFHGYNGEYSSSDSILTIGGYNSSGGLVYGWNGLNGENYEIYNYNYCEEWGIEDPYGLDHCKLFTNYDNVGDFFGTGDLSAVCINADESEYATNCHIDQYPYLPIGYNFMRAASSPYNDCGISPINDNTYYNENKKGFTEEQFANIRSSIETDYIGCINPNEVNYNQYALIDLGYYDECGVCSGDNSSCAGCLDPVATNYNPDATVNDGSCDYTSEFASPSIDAIVDIPQDQGGYVGIQYHGSIYDYGQYGYNITKYSFWRELDEEGDPTILGNNYWEWVGDMPAQEFEYYGYTAPTIADSNAYGDFISIFLVIAHTDDDDIFFLSDPDSGRSIDNLAPGTPELASVEANDDTEEVVLTWYSLEDEDLSHFALYRNTTSSFTPSEETLCTTLRDTSYTDTELDNNEYFYVLSAFDYNGNESGYSEEISVSFLAIYDGSALPAEYALQAAYPNPFNPITTIRYGLAQNSDVQISIYNINGRLITTLINEFKIAGYHFITWDASSYSSGIYFLNMSAGETLETKKMVLIK